MSERTQPLAGPIRVGDFVVDPRSGEMRGAAGRQLLAAQPLQVLLALGERPGELVTRDELRSRLWPADTYVDFEHGLNAVMKRLRDALGDAADTPRYIETVPRRGYRLIAPVASLEPVGTPVADIAHAAGDLSTTISRTSRAILAAAATLAVAASSLAVSRSRTAG